MERRVRSTTHTVATGINNVVGSDTSNNKAGNGERVRENDTNLNATDETNPEGEKKRFYDEETKTSMLLI